jgi:hypothetical protein
VISAWNGVTARHQRPRPAAPTFRLRRLLRSRRHFSLPRTGLVMRVKELNNFEDTNHSAELMAG